MQEPRANHAILEAHLRGLEGRIEECVSTKADKAAVPLRTEVGLQACPPSVCRLSEEARLSQDHETGGLCLDAHS